MARETGYYLGVDAGGTKTYALIADGTGRALGWGAAGTANWESVGLEGARAAIAAALEGALATAGLRTGDLSAAGYGLAGLDWPSDEERLRPMIASLGVPGPQTLVNDAFVGLRAGTDDGCGVVVIAGTGAVVAGRNRAGATFRTFGLGFHWGDHGGAPELVDLATRAIAHAYIGRGPATRLTELFLEAEGARDVPDMAERATRGERMLPRGRLAPLVFAAAEEGDRVAQALIAEIGRDLGASAAAVAGRLDMCNGPFELVLAGGVFRAGSALLRDTLLAQVRATAPQAYLSTLTPAPVVGGVLLALDAAGAPSGRPVRERLAHGIEGTLA
ncbi:MAG TPA: BadF/BadG/BcrA/BcrD ATPase family protein [Roseiflexaceae bacterium]|nr:BadF/BadG/BcrA/BcrD ATPase family protein [Roseiflexaceae bacterium]